MIDIIKEKTNSITPHDVLNLSLDDNMPLTWLIVHSLSFVWNKRLMKKEGKLEDCLATLLDKSSLLKQTKYKDITTFIENVIV